MAQPEVRLRRSTYPANGARVNHAEGLELSTKPGPRALCGKRFLTGFWTQRFGTIDEVTCLACLRKLRHRWPNPPRA